MKQFIGEKQSQLISNELFLGMYHKIYKIYTEDSEEMFEGQTYRTYHNIGFADECGNFFIPPVYTFFQSQEWSYSERLKRVIAIVERSYYGRSDDGVITLAGIIDLHNTVRWYQKTINYQDKPIIYLWEDPIPIREWTSLN